MADTYVTIRAELSSSLILIDISTESQPIILSNCTKLDIEFLLIGASFCL
jgi:hypothetical protein